jgi:hypothetical protein
MDDRERAIRQRLKDDFEHYAPRCLKIRTKEGQVLPFELNKEQLYIHQKLEEQLKEKGKIRAIILKGRQQGCSTYVEGRFYWKVTHRKGVRAYILTHEEDASKNIFEMAERYYENCHQLVRPEKSASNAKELEFGNLDSGYRVGTAGNKAAGRSGTNQYFHGSEVAYWPNAQQHAAGALQTVPDVPDTEVILESTANGIGNYFHQLWQKAESGQSEYIAIFIPWFWQEKYRKPIPQGFSLDDDEREYKALYDLDDEQIYWRRLKTEELGSGWEFKKEYPATAAEAFEASDDDSFIPPQLVAKARKTIAQEYGALIIGVDPARFGDDRTSIVRRRGRVAYRLESHAKKDNMEVAGILVQIIKSEKPKKIFIDSGGGAGIVDRLREMGYSEIVKPVEFGGKPLDDKRYINKRAEMWGELKDWLKDSPCQIPDLDSLQTDICTPKYKYDSNSRIALEKKEDIKKRGLRSPDEADALALTFAFPVSAQAEKPLKYPNSGVV